MTKRSRRRRPKRSSPGARRGQDLARRVRELYRPGADVEAWSDEIDVGPDPPGGVGATAEAEPTRDDHGDVPPDAFPCRVVELFSGAGRVEPEDGGEARECALPSRLARDQQAAVAVGDEVLAVPHGDGLRVVRVLPRRTALSRPDPHNPRRERVIAANVDVVVQVSSVVRPPLRPSLVDRYLIAIERGGAEPLLVVNKVDLLTAEELERELRPLEVHRRAGLAVLALSAKTGAGLDELAAALAGRTAVFVGHSGVGKSSLLNTLEPELEIATAEVSRRYARGRHTTTRSRLYRLGGFRVIDTPGIRELGLWRMTPQELAFYFPDFAAFALGCKFNDCTHSHEPSCAVAAAVEAGEIPETRYETYLRILASLAEDDAGP